MKKFLRLTLTAANMISWLLVNRKNGREKRQALGVHGDLDQAPSTTPGTHSLALPKDTDIISN